MNRHQLEKTFGGPVSAGRPERDRGLAFWRRAQAHLWCGACQRTFPNGYFRELDGERACPYAGCAGTLRGQARGWAHVRAWHPAYPLDPWMDVRYPHTPVERR